MDLYLIPGLGADHRIFSRLDTGTHTVHHLDHPVMPEGSSLRDFARQLAASVDAASPHALVGMSMGGMVAQELAAFTTPGHTVIISSWKDPEEMPPALRLLRGKHPERLLTKAFLKRTMPLVRWQMGVESPGSVELLDQLVTAHTLEQIKVQVDATLNWNGPEAKVSGLVHIHGDNDRLMPIQHIHNAQVVKGGTHFMVHDQADAVSVTLLSALESQGGSQ